MEFPPVYDPIRDELRQVEETLRRVSRNGDFPLLAELMGYMLDAPGKRIRPAVTLMSFKLFPHDPGIANLMAAAVEMLHVATLVHDDTVDKTAVRRGRATVSSRWGKDVAVLVGDYVFSAAVGLVCDAVNTRVTRVFSHAIMALSAGELREFTTSYDWQLTREQYWERIRDKTASLFSAATQSAGILSGAPERHVQALKSYGLNLGMAFQVIDDILDFEGSEDVLGKPVGSDLSQGVVTLPAILLAERHPERNCIQEAFDNREDPRKLRAAVEKIRSSSIMEEASDIAAEFSRKAGESLDVLPDGPARRSLIDLAEYVVRRDR